MIRGITGHTPARCSQNYTFMDSVANPEKALKYSLLDGGSWRDSNTKPVASRSIPLAAIFLRRNGRSSPAQSGWVTFYSLNF